MPCANGCCRPRNGGGGLVVGVLLKPLLSWRMLKDEVLAVEAALQQSLPARQRALELRLVSRDTSATRCHHRA